MQRPWSLLAMREHGEKLCAPGAHKLNKSRRCGRKLWLALHSSPGTRLHDSLERSMETPSSARGKNPKALFLSPQAPYPTIGGGPLRTASLLEYLARSFSVHAIIFREPGELDPASAIPSGRVDKLDVVNLPYHSKQPLAR